MLTLLILLILLCLVLGVTTIFFGYKLFVIVDQLEENQLWVQSLERDVEKTYNDMKLLDEANMFSKDDEVGVIFSDLVTLINKLHQGYK